MLARDYLTRFSGFDYKIVDGFADQTLLDHIIIETNAISMKMLITIVMMDGDNQHIHDFGITSIYPDPIDNGYKVIVSFTDNTYLHVFHRY